MMNDQEFTQEEFIDDLAIAIDTLTVENFAMRSQMKALEEALLAVIITHPETKESMLEGYASRLKDGIGLIELIKDIMHHEIGEELVERMKVEMQEHVNKILLMRQPKDLLN